MRTAERRHRTLRRIIGLWFRNFHWRQHKTNSASKVAAQIRHALKTVARPSMPPGCSGSSRKRSSRTAGIRPNCGRACGAAVARSSRSTTSIFWWEWPTNCSPARAGRESCRGVPARETGRAIRRSRIQAVRVLARPHQQLGRSRRSGALSDRADGGGEAGRASRMCSAGRSRAIAGTGGRPAWR